MTPIRRLLTLGALVTLSSVTFARQPNILFISIDDLRPQLGAYGLGYMHTPNLDQLATEGRLFTRHYVQVPTCGPSRACLLTGKNLRSDTEISHPYLGESLAGRPVGEFPETFIEHLKRNGYRTIGMGKISHSGNGRIKGGVPELPHSWDNFVDDPVGGNLVHAFAHGKDRTKDKMPPYECLDLPDEAYPDGRLAQLAISQLDEFARADQPFFMAVGFYKPHLPFCAPKKYWDLYDRASLPLSPNPDLPTGVDASFLHESSEFFDHYPGGREKGAAGKRLSDDYAREIIHANFAATSYADAQVGKVLTRLKALKLDQNTIVIVWGDHGWHLGDHTIWGKHSAFDRALNSTLLIKTPGMAQPGQSTAGLAATVDLYPTLCELTGTTPPPGLEGTSLLPLLRDPTQPGKAAVHSYWRHIISMRTDRYRMAVMVNGTDKQVMLFDHTTDPNETSNLAPAHPEIVAQLMPLLETGNRGFLAN